MLPLMMGVTAVWVTVVVLLSDVYVARDDEVTVVWVTGDVQVSDFCVAVGDGFIVVWVTAAMLVNDVCVAAAARGSSFCAWPLDW
jgi:hypothetical protein